MRPQASPEPSALNAERSRSASHVQNAGARVLNPMPPFLAAFHAVHPDHPASDLRVEELCASDTSTRARSHVPGHTSKAVCQRPFSSVAARAILRSCCPGLLVSTCCCSPVRKAGTSPNPGLQREGVKDGSLTVYPQFLHHHLRRAAAEHVDAECHLDVRRSSSTFQRRQYRSDSCCFLTRR